MRPTFFVDRSLGRRIVPARLSEAGWQVVIHDDVFGERAHHIEDLGNA